MSCRYIISYHTRSVLIGIYKNHPPLCAFVSLVSFVVNLLQMGGTLRCPMQETCFHADTVYCTTYSCNTAFHERTGITLLMVLPTCVTSRAHSTFVQSQNLL